MALIYFLESLISIIITSMYYVLSAMAINEWFLSSQRWLMVKWDIYIYIQAFICLNTWYSFLIFFCIIPFLSAIDIDFRQIVRTTYYPGFLALSSLFGASPCLFLLSLSAHASDFIYFLQSLFQIAIVGIIPGVIGGFSYRFILNQRYDNSNTAIDHTV